jgi:hypothetical protein
MQQRRGGDAEHQLAFWGSRVERRSMSGEYLEANASGCQVIHRFDQVAQIADRFLFGIWKHQQAFPLGGGQNSDSIVQQSTYSLTRRVLFRASAGFSKL